MLRLCVCFFLISSAVAACSDDSSSGPPDDTGASDGGGASDSAGDGADDTLDGSNVTDVAEEASLFVIWIQGRTLAEPEQEVVLEAALVGGEVNGDLSYTWSTDTGTWLNDDGAATRTVAFDDEGVHIVDLTVTDAAEDQDRASFAVVVVDGDNVDPIGDVDGNGTIDQTDLDLLAEFMSEETVPTQSEVAAADLDLDGRLTARDASWLETALSSGEAPSVVWPTEGARGRRVQVIHPALLDPGASMEMHFGDDQATGPVRQRPGYATTMVPLDATEAAEVDLTLWADGSEVARWTFDVRAPAEASDTPGSTVIKGLELVESGAAILKNLAPLWAEEAGLESDPQTLVAVWFDVSLSDVAARAAEAAEAMAAVDRDVMVLFEEIAMANGLAESVASLELVTEELAEFGTSSLTVAEGEALASIICAINVIADEMEDFADLVDFTGTAVGAGATAATLVPPLKLIMEIADKVLSVMEIGLDIATYLARFLPEFNDRLGIGVPDAVLYPGDSVPVTVGVSMGFRSDLRLCDNPTLEVNSFLTMVGRALSDEAIGSLPVAGPLLGLVTDQEHVDAFLDQVVLDAYPEDTRAVIVELVGPLCAMVVAMQDDPPIVPLDAEDRVSPGCGAIVASGGGEEFSWTCTSACARSDGGTAAHVLFDMAENPQLCGRVTRSSLASVQCTLCGPGNCEEGCCDSGGECQGGTSNSACGAAGRSCEDCTENLRDTECRAHTCSCVSTCDPGDGPEPARSCDGDWITECTEVLTGSGCFAWLVATDCALLGGTCENGACVGGCGEHNCSSGCCGDPGTGTVTCLGGRDFDACGIGGFSCNDCDASDLEDDIDQCNVGRCDCSHFCEPDEAVCVDARGFADSCTGHSSTGCRRFERTTCDLTRHEHCFDGECCEQEDNEPNETKETATPISEPGVTGMRIHSQDTDVYSFELCDGGEAQAILGVIPGGDAVMAIEYQDGDGPIQFERQVNIGADGSGAWTFRNHSGATRTYFLTVGSFRDACMSYWIIYDTDCPGECLDDRLEDNDVSGQAVDLSPSGTTLESLILSSGDEDYFNVRLCAGGTLDVDATFVDGDGESEGNLDFEIIVQGSVVASGDSSTSNESQSYELLGIRDRTATIRVFTNDEDACISYNLTVSADGCACREDFFEDGGDDTIDTGNFVSALNLRRPQGETYSSMTIASPAEGADDDWFEIPLCGDGVFLAELRYTPESGDLDLALWSDGDSAALIETITGTGTPVVQTFGNESPSDIIVNLRVFSENVPACVPYELWMIEYCPCDEDEWDNASFGTAFPVTETTSATLSDSEDDWFSFAVTDGCRATVIADVDERRGDHDLHVFDSEAQLLGVGESGRNSLRMSWLNDLGTEENIAARVSTPEANVCAPYDISITEECGACSPDHWEPNDLRYGGPWSQTADGGFRNLSVSTGNDDWFSINTNVPDCTLQVDLSYDGDVVPELVLVPETGSPIDGTAEGDGLRATFTPDGPALVDLHVSVEGADACVLYEVTWTTTCD